MSEETLKLLQERATNGDPHAQFELGQHHEFGKGTAINHMEAAYWYELSATQGYALAEYALALLYQNGRGVEQDIDKAIALYTRSADKATHGHKITSVYLLPRQRHQAQPGALHQWYRKVAQQGHFQASVQHGSCYARGEGCEPNLIEADGFREHSSLCSIKSAQRKL